MYSNVFNPASGYGPHNAGLTVFEMIRIGLFRVLFHGPKYLSGGATGQNWHPDSDSETITDQKRNLLEGLQADVYDRLRRRGENGFWLLHDTAERSRSTTSFVFTVLSIAEPSPAIAAASPVAMVYHVVGNSRPLRMNRRARPLVRMPGSAALETTRGFW